MFPKRNRSALASAAARPSATLGTPSTEDDAECVGEGTHERFVIQSERFLAGLAKKAQHANNANNANEPA